MATRTASLVMSNSTDASFRLWINEIHNALIAFGWVQTSDTGQINFATATRPAATNTTGGFAVYRMADSLQSTCAVFMRLDFGTSQSTDSPRILIQFSIGGTSGAGVLTGNVTTQQNIGSAAAAGSTRNMRTAGTTSSFRFAWGSIASEFFIFAVERDLDTSGAETSLGLNTAWMTGISLGKGSQFLELAGGTGPAELNLYGAISAQTSQSGGGNVGVGPVRCTLGPFRNPMKTLLIYAKTDFTADTTNPVTIYGASHTFLMLRPTDAYVMGFSNPSGCPALLWE